jgi:hypothetical protein
LVICGLTPELTGPHEQHSIYNERRNDESHPIAARVE